MQWTRQSGLGRHFDFVADFKTVDMVFFCNNPHGDSKAPSKVVKNQVAEQSGNDGNNQIGNRKDIFNRES